MGSIETWDYWEYEHHVRKLHEVLEKEKKARDGKDNGGQSLSDPRGQANKYLRDAQKGFKMPDASKFKR